MAEQDVQIEELPLDGSGGRLRRAREAAGLSLGDVAARTKIAERHLTSIEESRFRDLASRTYAVGFARAYARAVGLDEAAIAQSVRDELAAADNVRQPQQLDVFEPGDPARVPGSRLAWAAALGAVLVIVLVFVFWRSFFSPAVSLPELTAPRETASAAASAGAVAAPPPVAAGAPVVFTALAPDVWVKFYDAAGTQLMQKQMAQGETYAVPAGAVGPLLRTARPDALQITVGGRIVPRLSDKPISIKDVPVSAAALLGRPQAATAPVPISAVPASASVAPVAAPVVAAPQPAPRPTPHAAASPHAASPAAPSAARRQPAPAAPTPAPPQPAAGVPAPPQGQGETSTVSN